MTALEEYIFEQHPGDVGQTDLSWLAVSTAGVPQLTNDELLHSERGLPPEIKIVQSALGVIHTAFDPTQVIPAFHSIKDATPIAVGGS